MAQINEIVTELNTVATAFTGINTFEFEEIDYINDNRKKTYPVLLVDSRNIDVNVTALNRSNLPKQTIYGFKLFFLDDYHTSEQKTTTRAAKYSQMETLANQYLAEIQRRVLADSSLKFHLRDKQINNGFVVDEVHNDKLCQLVYDVSFTAYSDCTTGTFNY